MPRTLRKYQSSAAARLVLANGGILAFPPGTGKTATVAFALYHKFSIEKVAEPRVLVVCPNGPVLAHWQHELHDWGRLASVIGTGSPKQREAARELVESGGTLILNYEIMQRDSDALAEIEWDAIIFDESHRLKNRKTLTFKAALQIVGKRSPFVALVTGTPLLNRAEELWTSLKLLHPDDYRSFWKWAQSNFQINIRKYGGRRVTEIGEILPGRVTYVRVVLHDVMIYRPLSELLPDLPTVQESDVHVELTTAERQHYETMRKETWMVDGQDELIIAPNVLAKQLRLRQLASDWTAFGHEGIGSKGKAAVALANELLEDGEQVVIFCGFRATAEAITREIGERALVYHGGVPGYVRESVLNMFKGKHEVNALVATIKTLGEGADGLQHAARHMIFVDRDWTPARNEQAIARLRRSGQENGVTVRHIVADDTIDQTVLEALKRKQAVVDAIVTNGGK